MGRLICLFITCLITCCTNPVEPLSPNDAIILLRATPVIPQPPAIKDNLKHPAYVFVEQFRNSVEYFAAPLFRILDGIVENDIEPTIRDGMYQWEYGYAGCFYRLEVISGDSIRFRLKCESMYDSDAQYPTFQGWKLRDNRAGHFENVSAVNEYVRMIDWFREDGVARLEGLIPSYHVAYDSLRGGGHIYVGGYSTPMEYYHITWNREGIIISGP